MDKVSNYSFIICVCYLPPENNLNGRHAQEFFDHLTNISFRTADYDFCMFLGDVNGRCGEENDLVSVIDDKIIPNRVIVDNVRNPRGLCFIDFLKSIHYCILNGRFDPDHDNYTCISHRGKSVVDYMFLPHEQFSLVKFFSVLTVTDLCDKLNILPCRSMPDHSILCSGFTLPYYRNHETHTKNGNKTIGHITEPPNHRIFLKHNCSSIPENFMLSDAVVQEINDIIDRIETTNLNQNNIDQIYDQVCTTYYEEMDSKLKFFDTRQPKNSKRVLKPWWNEQLSNLFDHYKSAEKAYLKCTYRREKQSLFQNFKRKRKLFDREYRKSKRRYQIEEKIGISESETRNPQEFWKKINSLGRSKKKENDIPDQVIKDDGSISSDKIEKLDKWQSDFTKIYNPDANSNEIDEDVFKNNKFTESFVFIGQNDINDNITERETSLVIRLAKTKKAVGIDCLPNEVFKNESSVHLLTSLFNKCLNANIVPSLWSKAIIKPIPKSNKNDPRIPTNYRGISLISTVCKLYTNILNKRLVKYLETNDILEDEQNGFRKNRSCEDHIFSLTSIIRNRKAEKLDTFTCFVDMAKAFDRVNRDILYIKLANIGLTSGNFIETIKTLYNECKATIDVNGDYTQYFDIMSGVKQGDVISPTLFSIFINDLAFEIKQLHVGINLEENLDISLLLFADDIVLIAPTESNLQIMLAFLCIWCTRNCMSVNVEKTKIVHFRNKAKERTNVVFCLGESVVEICNSYKYLGVVLNEFLDFTETANVLAESASRAFSSLIHSLFNKTDLMFATYKKIYSSKIIPIMDYSASVWGFKCYSKIDTVHNRIIKYFLGTPKSTSTPVIYGDTGLMPPIIRRKIAMLRFWKRLIFMNNNRLTKRIFLYDFAKRKSNWSKDMKQVFCEMQKNENFNDMTIFGSRNNFLHVAEEALINNYKSKWQNEIGSQTRLYIYKDIKESFTCETYVKMNLPKHLRSVLCQFRSGILPLEIQVGRFYGINRENRFCKQCLDGIVETEIHFLFKCKKYEQLRSVLHNKLINCNIDIYSNNNHCEVLKTIFQTHAAIKALGIFIVDALKCRQ